MAMAARGVVVPGGFAETQPSNRAQHDVGYGVAILPSDLTPSSTQEVSRLWPLAFCCGGVRSTEVDDA
jgi:hypothetical protein